MRFAALCAVAAVATAADLSYIDLRADLGTVDGGGGYAALGVVGSSIYGDVSGPTVPMGLVLGLRVERTRLKADVGGGKERIDLTGGSLQAGFAFLPTREDTVEILFNWGSGGTSAGGGVTFETSDGTYSVIGPRVGWYHTFPARFQLGAWGGYSRYTLDLDGASGKGDGLDLGVSGGYRF